MQFFGYRVATKFYTRHDITAFLPYAVLYICLPQFGLKQKTQNTLNGNDGGQTVCEKVSKVG